MKRGPGIPGIKVTQAITGTHLPMSSIKYWDMHLRSSRVPVEWLAVLQAEQFKGPI